MEELQSTEILDREILEDARKRAHRILKTADDTIKTNTANWEKKLVETVDKLAQKYTQQGKMVIDEVMARLPIDKRRTKAKKIETLLDAATAAWYARLSRNQVLDVLKKELAKRLAVGNTLTAAGEARVLIHKIERAEAEVLLQAVLPGKSCVIETVPSTSAYPEIVLETPEARIYASISKTVHFFLAEKRAELVEALIGETT